MNNKIYDILNKIQRWLGAIGVAYFGLANIWGLPYGNEINKTIIVLGTLIATILEFSSSIWKTKNKIIIKNINEDLKQ